MDQYAESSGGCTPQMEETMEPIKDASHLYEVERRARYAERPGFRISELQISPTQKVPWHFHTNIRDTFYVVEGKIRWQKAYGLADVENAVPAETSTVFRIASVTKPLTATAAMQLAEHGKLDLDAPVQKYAPSFPAKAQTITTRQLLGHLSGIRHYKAGEGERTTHYDSLATALEIFKDDALVREPGTGFTYSTFGYTLLGVAIEGASGMRYTDYMRTNVFEPAGMSHTQADDPSVIVPKRARGYSPKVYGQFDGQWRNAALMDPSYKLPGGGMLSTVAVSGRLTVLEMAPERNG